MTRAERRSRLRLRRERDQQLALADAKRRCVCCRRALPVAFLEVIGVDGRTERFCALSCRLDHLEAQEILHAR
jgi:hypothetical protein